MFAWQPLPLPIKALKAWLLGPKHNFVHLLLFEATLAFHQKVATFHVDICDMTTWMDSARDMNKGGKFLKKLWCCVGGKV